MASDDLVPPALRDAVVLDAAAQAHAFGELLGETTLVVFLRHFGCVHCARQVDGLMPRIDELDALRVTVVVVTSARPEELVEYARRTGLDKWPVRLVTDPALAAYRAAGMQRSRASGLAPRNVWHEVAAWAHGYLPGRRAGDAAQLGGALLIADGRVHLRRAARTPADIVDLNDVVDVVLALHVERHGATRRV